MTLLDTKAILMLFNSGTLTRVQRTHFFSLSSRGATVCSSFSVILIEPEHAPRRIWVVESFPFSIRLPGSHHMAGTVLGTVA